MSSFSVMLIVSQSQPSCRRPQPLLGGVPRTRKTPGGPIIVTIHPGRESLIQDVVGAVPAPFKSSVRALEPRDSEPRPGPARRVPGPRRPAGRGAPAGVTESCDRILRYAFIRGPRGISRDVSVCVCVWRYIYIHARPAGPAARGAGRPGGMLVAHYDRQWVLVLLGY